MRAIWTGDVSFGLVAVPVKVYSATESHGLHGHMVDPGDGTRIRYKRVREGGDDEVDYDDIGTEYRTDDGETAILTRDELAELPVEQDHEIDVTQFVPADQIDPVMFDHAYFLEPASKNTKAYVLLRIALADSDLLAIATFTLRGRTKLAALRVYEEVILMQTLLWPDEIRSANFPSLDKDASVRPQERKMARSLVESMTGDFDPSAFSDTYQQQLADLVEAKASGDDAPAAATTDDTESDGDDDVDDLLAALRASVKDRGGAGAGKSGSGSAKKGDDDKASSAKKTPAKKTPAKKAPAKKSSAKKTGSSTEKKSPRCSTSPPSNNRRMIAIASASIAWRSATIGQPLPTTCSFRFSPLPRPSENRPSARICTVAAFWATTAG